nr:hypothetical protein CFP56_46334 [Quercus suber]
MTRMIAHIIERLHHLEGLCPFPDVQLPPKFKMPKMDSFDGIGNPKYHLNQGSIWRSDAQLAFKAKWPCEESTSAQQEEVNIQAVEDAAYAS